jgi:outer membrane lipopolysaccharide assembly protein LptE/RlpB
MKRVLAWLMMTLLLLSLTACGSSKNESLEGTWKWTMDVTD